MLGTRPIPSRRVRFSINESRILKSAVIAEQRAAKRLDHVTVSARLFVRCGDSFREGPRGLVSHHTRGSCAVGLAGAAVVNTIGPIGQLERSEAQDLASLTGDPSALPISTVLPFKKGIMSPDRRS